MTGADGDLRARRRANLKRLLNPKRVAFVGDELSFEGRISAMEAVEGRRMVDLERTCRRASDNAVIVQAAMRFDLMG